MRGGIQFTPVIYMCMPGQIKGYDLLCEVRPRLVTVRFWWEMISSGYLVGRNLTHRVNGPNQVFYN